MRAPCPETGYPGFAYAIGVLHHLREDVRAGVFEEIRRVLKPGGLLLVHETNPRNPVFRFYMGDVCPLMAVFAV